MSNLVKKLLLALSAIVFIVTMGAAPAAATSTDVSTMILADEEDPGQADDMDQSNWDAAYTRCVTGAANRWADDQMKSEGTAGRQVNDHDPRSNAQHQGQRREMSEEATEKEREEFRKTDEWKEYQQEFINEGVDGRLDYLNRFKCQLDRPTNTVGVAVSRFWDDPFGKFVDALISGNTQALQQVMTLWLNYSINGEEMEGLASGVTNTVWLIAFSVFVISLILIGARMAALRRQGIADGMEELGMFYGRFLVIAIAVPFIIPFALSVTDVITDQIITLLPEGESLEDAIDESIPAKGIFEPALLLVPILFSLVGSITQMVALAARVLILPILVGLLPVSAAFGGSETGRMSSKSMLTWIVAALAFKPLAALLYVMAFAIAGGDSVDGADGTMGAVLKLLVLGIAGFSPLMVIKIVSPLFANTAGQNSAATGGAAMAALGGTAAAALGGGAAVAAGAGKALGGGTGATGSSSSNSGGSSSPGGSSTPPNNGGGPPGGPGGSDGPRGGDSGSGAQPTGGNPAAASGGGSGQQIGGDKAGSSPSQPAGGDGGSGKPGDSSGGGSPAPRRQSRGHRAMHSTGRGVSRAGGGMKVAAKVASRTGSAYGRGISRTGQMMDDIGK